MVVDNIRHLAVAFECMVPSLVGWLYEIDCDGGIIEVLDHRVHYPVGETRTDSPKHEDVGAHAAGISIRDIPGPRPCSISIDDILSVISIRFAVIVPGRLLAIGS